MENKDETLNPQEPTKDGPNRRQFLTVLSLALGGLAASLVGIPVVGFILSPFLRKPAEVWRPVGRVEDFRVGTTSAVTISDPSPLPWAGVTAKSAAWLRRDSQDTFIAYSVNCTHLGCPVRWLPDANLFMCPCHGGVYDQIGRPVAGPPPKPLVHYPVRVNNGEVEIRTSPIPITT